MCIPGACRGQRNGFRSSRVTGGGEFPSGWELNMVSMQKNNKKKIEAILTLPQGDLIFCTLYYGKIIE